MFKTRMLVLLLGFWTAAAAATNVKSQEWKLPLEFEANRGQFSPEVLYLARTPNHFVYLTRDGMTLGLMRGSQSGAFLRMKLVGSDPAAPVAPENRLQGISNYFIGNDPAGWQREVPHYERIRYRSVYPGIDLVFHGRGQSLEYDFAVSPGADPSAIRLRYGNAADLRVDSDGNLVIETSSGKVVQRLPLIYQETAGVRKLVRGNFRVSPDHEVHFEVGAYDHRRALVIDPTITYSTYIGGTGTLSIQNMTVDSNGNAYVTGQASSPDFPVVNPIKQFPSGVGLFRSSDQGNTWGAANSSLGTTKVLSLAPDPTNPAVAYAGTSRGVFKTTSSGNSWVSAFAGVANSSVTSVAVDPLAPATIYACTPAGMYRSTDAAVTWKLLTNAGAPVAVSVDSKIEGVIWVAYGFNYPIASLNNGDTFLRAGSTQIVATSVAVDPTNSLTVFFGTSSAGLFRTTDGGGSFTYITSGLAATNGSAVTVNAIAIDKRNSARILVGTNTGVYLSSSGGTSFQSTTGIGNRKVLSVTFDPNTDSIALAGTAGGGVYVSNDGGLTWTATGPANLDVNALAMSSNEQSTYAGLYAGTNAFVTKINAAGTNMVYSTYLGGSGSTGAYGVAVDAAGHAFVCGQTDAADFPTQNPYQQRFGGGTDMFVARLSASGSSLDASTFLGGRADDTCSSVAVDSSGNVYMAGATTLLTATTGSDFPASAGAFGKQSFGGQDCVVAKFDNSLQTLIYSSFLGGNNAEVCYGVAADSSGNAYVIGNTFSANFLTTQAPFGGSQAGGSATNSPGFVTKIKPDGSGLAYSALLGGSKGTSRVTGIAVDRAGRAYVTGYTQASDFPLTSNSLNKTVASGGKTFVTAIETDGSKLVYSTLLPGSNPDFGYVIALDSNSNAWIVGQDGSGTFPVTADALPHTVAPSAFTPWLAGLDATGSTLHATYLAGSAGGAVTGVAVGPDGSVYVAGATLSTDFTLTGTPFQKSQTPDYVAFVMRLVFPAAGGGGGTGGGGTGGGGTGSGPTITAAQNGASYVDGFPANAFLQIKGANLAAIASDNWDKSIVNGQLPTTLDGITVTVGGQPAYISYVSPVQINVIAPNIPAGPTSIVVKNSLGTSAAFTATAFSAQPAFFPMTGPYLIATHLDYSLAVKNGSYPGVSTVAAKPGETILLWGSGFGPTTPSAPVGQQLPSSPLYNTALPAVTIGGTPVTVVYSLLAPGFAGLNQVAITIPATMSDGDYAVVATVGGQSSPSSAMITVQR